MGVESVQSLASLYPDTIPPELIRPETEQVNVATTFQGPNNVPDIPIVDLGDPDMAKVVEAVAAASREWGICHVVNHGIPEDLIKRLQSAGKDFFALPREEKDKCAKPPETPGVDGYGSAIGRKGPEEKKKSWSDYLSHTVWPPSAINYRYWPQNPPSYREVNEEYAIYVRQVADKVFEALSLGLGLEENALKIAVGGEDVEYSLRINLYPPCPRPDLTIGLAAHTDFCAITIIVPNEVPGLQVLKDDRWFDAKYIPNALILQISDQIEILSNGEYKSALHRTIVDKEKVRMSWPVFVRPPPELVVGPLPEMVDHQNPAKFKTKKFKDYMYCKLNSIPQDYVHYKYI